MSIERTSPSEFSRRSPIMLLVICSIGLLLHHAIAVSSGDVYPLLLGFASSFGVLSLVGCLSPTIFFAIGKYGAHLPFGYKALAGLSFCTGFGLGMYALYYMY